MLGETSKKKENIDIDVGNSHPPAPSTRLQLGLSYHVQFTHSSHHPFLPKAMENRHENHQPCPLPTSSRPLALDQGRRPPQRGIVQGRPARRVRLVDAAETVLVEEPGRKRREKEWNTILFGFSGPNCHELPILVLFNR